MKQGLSPAGRLSDLAMRSRDAVETGSLASSSTHVGQQPLGEAMQQQLHRHMRDSSSLLEAAWAATGDVVDAAAHVPTQLLLLQSRVHFTSLVEQSVAERQLGSLERKLKHMRSTVIARLLDVLSKKERATLNALQTLLQEQQHTAASLASAEAVGREAELWLREMRFYETAMGRFECRCYGKTVLVDPEHLDPTNDSILVTTDLTKEVRATFMEAMYGGPGMLLSHGPAGTGKTETLKDIAAMLGLSACVINASADLFDDDAKWSELITKAGVLIIDEANRASKSALQSAARAAKAANVPLCLTFNPGISEQLVDVLGLMGRQSASVKMTLPERPRILSSMLACEGLQHADELGENLSGLFNSLESRCSKQTHYDFGLRKLKQVCKETGDVVREVGCRDEQQAMLTAAQLSILPGLSPADRQYLNTGLQEHFSASSLELLTLPSDFWSNAASKLSMALKRRHCGACLPVMPSEESLVLTIAEEEAQHCGAAVEVMSGTMGDLSHAQLFGSVGVDGAWSDGQFTRALRRAVAGGKWMVVFCGDLTSEKDAHHKWTELNTVMDDNKKLRLPTGEEIHLGAANRILFVTRGLDHASPATISRLSVINLETQRPSRF